MTIRVGEAVSKGFYSRGFWISVSQQDAPQPRNCRAPCPQVLQHLRTQTDSAAFCFGYSTSEGSPWVPTTLNPVQLSLPRIPTWPDPMHRPCKRLPRHKSPFIAEFTHGRRACGPADAVLACRLSSLSRFPCSCRQQVFNSKQDLPAPRLSGLSLHLTAPSKLADKTRYCNININSSCSLS